MEYPIKIRKDWRHAVRNTLAMMLGMMRMCPIMCPFTYAHRAMPSLG